MNNEIERLRVEQLEARIFNDETSAGIASADFVANQLNKVIDSKGGANLILATGASQFAFLEAIKTKNIPWDKVTVFHLDEYLGLPVTHNASFRKYLKERIVDTIRPLKMYYIEGDAADADKELNRYEKLLADHPIDVACIGIGENGHIAFNDPGVADFNDPKLIKVVDLDDACRRQQLGEGWFGSLDEVPKQAMSLTVTAIMNCDVISCMCPGERKAEAIYNTFNAPISTDCPATILRKHKNTVLFLDEGSASKL